MSMPQAFASAQRSSERLAVGEGTKVLDEATRRRRLEKQLRKLEEDNVQSDPHANIIPHKALPKFAEELTAGEKKASTSSAASASPLFELASKKGKKLRLEVTRTRFRKSFAQLLEEEQKGSLKDEEPEVLTYSEVRARPSAWPARKFCSVCGFFSKYNCVECGLRFCSIRCRAVHKDTRCLKWTS